MVVVETRQEDVAVLSPTRVPAVVDIDHVGRAAVRVGQARHRPLNRTRVLHVGERRFRRPTRPHGAAHRQHVGCGRIVDPGEPQVVDAHDHRSLLPRPRVRHGQHPRLGRRPCRVELRVVQEVRPVVNLLVPFPTGGPQQPYQVTRRARQPRRPALGQEPPRRALRQLVVVGPIHEVAHSSRDRGVRSVRHQGRVARARRIVEHPALPEQPRPGRTGVLGQHRLRVHRHATRRHRVREGLRARRRGDGARHPQGQQEVRRQRARRPGPRVVPVQRIEAQRQEPRRVHHQARHPQRDVPRICLGRRHVRPRHRPRHVLRVRRPRHLDARATGQHPHGRIVVARQLVVVRQPPFGHPHQGPRRDRRITQCERATGVSVEPLEDRAAVLARRMCIRHGPVPERGPAQQRRQTGADPQTADIRRLPRRGRIRLGGRDPRRDRASVHQERQRAALQRAPRRHSRSGHPGPVVHLRPVHVSTQERRCRGGPVERLSCRRHIPPVVDQQRRVSRVLPGEDFQRLRQPRPRRRGRSGRTILPILHPRRHRSVLHRLRLRHHIDDPVHRHLEEERAVLLARQIILCGEVAQDTGIPVAGEVRGPIRGAAVIEALLGLVAVRARRGRRCPVGR